MRINISPRWALVALLVPAVMLTAASLLLNLSSLYADWRTPHSILRMFDVDQENNIPTVYSVLALFLTCLSLLVITHHHKQNKEPYVYWLGLTLAFFYLSVDEGSSIHDFIAIRNLPVQWDILGFGWVVPYGALVLFLGCVYFKFWLQLVPELRKLLLIAGVLYVVGAIGCEMLEAIDYDKTVGVVVDLKYVLLCTAEELLEMVANAIFLYTFLRYIQLNAITVSLSCSMHTDTETEN